MAPDYRSNPTTPLLHSLQMALRLFYFNILLVSSQVERRMTHELPDKHFVLYQSASVHWLDLLYFMHGCVSCSFAYSNVPIHLIILIFISVYLSACRISIFLQVGLWAARQQDVPTPPLVTMVVNEWLPACHSLLALARICLAFLCSRSCILCHLLAWFMYYLTSVSYCVTAPTAIGVTNCSVLPLYVWSIICGSTPYRQEVWAKAMVTYLFIHEFAPPSPRFILFIFISIGFIVIPHVPMFILTHNSLVRLPPICSVFFIWLLGYPA